MIIICDLKQQPFIMGEQDQYVHAEIIQNRLFK